MPNCCCWVRVCARGVIFSHLTDVTSIAHLCKFYSNALVSVVPDTFRPKVWIQLGNNWRKGDVIATVMEYTGFVAVEGEQLQYLLRETHQIPGDTGKGEILMTFVF